ncbi:hypothetical protein K490DRAFT_66941 [Saccharata proteae CBS 121410]|uniref:DUF1772-domain-containing protein n=1 Tax=Saccharata proteae CBS 121410 TaxID=1314787 RepID=A0A9P4LXS5_9PEZI|nr:hypothetical protein K490DRAFT_66941 [Saccharata proteae CBS 121410]
MTSNLGLGPYRLTQLFSTTTLALLFGSTTWASLAVMPSLIDAPLSTHAKLSVFKGLILRANAILAPAFLTTIAGLSFLAHGTSLSASRRNHLVALGAMVGALGLQVPILPRNAEMVRVVDEGRGRDDDGSEADWRIGELWKFNLGRVVLTGMAFLVEVWEMVPKRDGMPLPVRV